MNKVLLGLMVVAMVAAVHAADPANKIQGDLEITGTLTLGTALSTPTVSGSTVVKSGTYSTMVSDQTDTKIDMVQHGIKTVVIGAAVTNTFSPVFIETPTVIYQYVDSTIPATNVLTVASNSFIVAAAQTNVRWIAVGRVK